MFMRIAGLALLSFSPAIGSAQMSADAFDAFTRGKTLTYSVDGAPYGVERYLPDRRVEWSFRDGECKAGVWYPVGNQICFDYEDLGPTQCWIFTPDGTGLSATFAGEGGDGSVYSAIDTGEAMVCLGPKIGV